MTLLYTPRGYFYSRGNTESGYVQLYFLEREKKRQTLYWWYLQPIDNMYQHFIVLWVMLNYLDRSYSTFLLISGDAGTGTGWGMWCVCSPGGHQYKCTGCIPGPSPKLGAICLHGSTSCHCINTLREMENIWALCYIWKRSWSCEEHVYKITKKHLCWIFCLTFLVFPLQ